MPWSRILLVAAAVVIAAFFLYRHLDEPDTVPEKIAEWLGPQCDVHDMPANLLREGGYSARAAYNADETKTVGCENVGPGTSYLRFAFHRNLVWAL